MVNFGSCGYAGLETHPRLTSAVIDAVQRYGTQFSSSRSYLSAPGYQQAEQQLSEMFGRPTAIASNTSMANMSVITTLVKDDDVMLLDAQAHRSVQAAATVTRGRGVPAHVIPHGNLDVLERKVRELTAQYRRVWFLGDGLYSMFGDLAPVRELGAMVERFDNLWLHIDDAHSVSWTGRHGRGHALEQLSGAAAARTVVTGSLNKAFGAAGGAMAFPDDALRHEVRTIGWPMMFSGPLQPPMLAAVIASARLHLSDEITGRQRRVVDKIELFNAEAARQGLPLVEALAENLPISLADNGFSPERLLHGFHRQFAGRAITLREVGAW